MSCISRENNHRLNSTSFLIKNLKFEDSDSETCFGSNSLSFYLIARYFRRLHLEVRKNPTTQQNKPKMTYSCDLADMDCHGWLSWMTIMDDCHGRFSWITVMDKCCDRLLVCYFYKLITYLRMDRQTDKWTEVGTC